MRPAIFQLTHFLPTVTRFCPHLPCQNPAGHRVYVTASGLICLAGGRQGACKSATRFKGLPVFTKRTAPLQELERGRATCSMQRSVCLSAQEGRNIELVVLRASYAQGPAARADRDPEARNAGHIPRRAASAGPPAGARSAVAAARIAAPAAPCAGACGASGSSRRGRARPRPAVASATCGASRDGRRRVRRAAL